MNIKKHLIVVALIAAMVIMAGCNRITVKRWNTKGIELIKSGNYKEAIQAFDEALKIDRENIAALLWKGYGLASLEKYQEAITVLEEAIKIDPKEKDAWNGKAVCLGKMGKYQEAINAFDEEIKLSPREARGWYARAGAYSMLREKTEAMTDLAKAAELNIGYKKTAKKDNDFNWLWDDEDFKKLVNQ